MKTKFLPKLILLSVLSMLIYSCTAEDPINSTSNNNTIQKSTDTIGTPIIPNPRG
jgi:hypothetical protein